MAKKKAPVLEETPAGRGKVLGYYTATELKDLIGADVKIGVSLKELKAIVLKARSAEILAEAGL